MKYDESHDRSYINPISSEFGNTLDEESRRVLDNAFLMAQLVDWLFSRKWTHPDRHPS